MRILILICTLLACWQVQAANPHTEYAYPYNNSFQATIVGTPPELQPKLVADNKIRQRDYRLRLRPEREQSLPSNFWPVKTFTYRLAKQKHSAPLIFIIAGTGASFDSGKTEFLKKLFYGAGFHVVQISSPTSYDFMVAASASATPGYSPQDANELYQVMLKIKHKHRRLPVSSWHLTGYSLGGLHAGFVSQLDSQQQQFNFKRVLLLNPPVNLYTSVSNLDRMANVYLPGLNEGHNFFQEIFDKLAAYYERKGNFSAEFSDLDELQNSQQALSNEEMAMLIGTMFRFTAADISFTSDLINRRGLITPLDSKISDRTSLTPMLELALNCDFSCYMQQQLLPHWQQKYQGQDLEQLIAQTSIYAIEQHLQENQQLAVLHNQDDVILGEGDLGYLQQHLQQRLLLFPNGGHMGNLEYAPVAEKIMEFFHGY